jgi:hypothetical protein
MKQVPEIKALLEQVRTTAGPSFRVDEEAVLQEYQQLNANRSGIAIKVLTIGGGFLASLALLGCFFIAGIYDSGPGSVVTGLLFLGGAIWISKIYDQLILDTTAVCLYCMGVFLFIIGLLVENMNSKMICLPLIPLAIITLFLVQNYILSLLAVLLLNGAIITQLLLNNQHLLLSVYTAIVTAILTLYITGEAQWINAGKKSARLYHPARLGLTLSLLAALAYISKNNFIPAVTAIAAILYITPPVLTLLGIQEAGKRAAVYIALVLILAPTLFAPAIAGALLLMLLCFRVNYKTGFVLGILALVYFVSQYYYDLQWTLLTKSLVLMGSGLLFVLVYFLTHKKLGQHE